MRYAAAIVLTGCAMHARAYFGVASDRSGSIVEAGVLAGVFADDPTGTRAHVPVAGIVGNNRGGGVALGFDIADVSSSEGDRIGWRVGGLATIGVLGTALFHHGHVAVTYLVADAVTPLTRRALVVGLEGQVGAIRRSMDAAGDSIETYDFALGGVLTVEFLELSTPDIRTD